MPSSPTIAVDRTQSKTQSASLDSNHPFIRSDRKLQIDDHGVAIDPYICYSQSMLANAYFFGHPVYGEKYFKTENRSPEFIDRWQAAIGTLDDKIVIDVGCGPGNLLASLGGKPKMLIGLDISHGALRVAQTLGYQTILADVQDLPLVSGCADVVMLNAVMHHADDMETVLREAARLVRPGGLLVTDMDPQKGAWDFKGIGLLLYRMRHPLYKLLRSKRYKTQEEDLLRLATEVHNQQPGAGIELSLYDSVLSEAGFDYQVCPHNHFLGREVLEGKVGKTPLRFWLGQWLSGIQPGTSKSGLSVMCVGRRKL